MVSTSPHDLLLGRLTVALLDAGWRPDALLDAAARVLGDPARRWLPLLVDTLLRRFPDEPPQRSLVAALVEDRWLAERLRERDTRPDPALTTPAGLARLLDLDGGELRWFADLRGLESTVTDSALLHHRRWWVAKRAGGSRLVEAPKPRLLEIQRRLLTRVVTAAEAHPAAHGARPGTGVLTAAAPHAGQAVVVHLDLEDSYASVTAGRVAGVLRRAGHPAPVAALLTGLLTTVTPPADRTAPRSRVDPDRLWRQRRRLAAPHLATGAATSAAVADLVALVLDRRLAGAAASLGFTRYVDDLCLSSADPAAPVDGMTRLAQRVVVAEDFRPAVGKTTVRRAGQQQWVAGLVVNDRPRVARSDVDRLRGRLHRLALDGGIDDHQWAQLAGQVAWASTGDPVRAGRLRSPLDRLRPRDVPV